MWSIKVGATLLSQGNTPKMRPSVNEGNRLRVCRAGPTRPKSPSVKMMYGGQGGVSVHKALATQV